jgi:glutamyl-tRNA reductase
MEINNFYCLGTSYKKAGLALRERLTFLSSGFNFLCEKIKSISGIKGIVILSTCNRIEIYYESSFERSDDLIALWAELQEIETDKLKEVSYLLQSKDALGHLFRVSAGLDSQIIGETEVLAQVKEAYFLACELGFSSSLLNRVFQRAIFIGKKIRVQTKISQGNISIASLALRLLERNSGSLENKKVVLLGAGGVIKAIVDNLVGKQVKAVVVSNRRYTKAQALARVLNGRAIYLKDLLAELREADILISATSSPYPLIRKKDIEEIISHKLSTINYQPLFIIDLALPRDVEEEVKEIPGVRFYSLEDINLSLEENYQKRLMEARRAAVLIEEKLEKFLERESRFTLVLTEKAFFNADTRRCNADGRILSHR